MAWISKGSVNAVFGMDLYSISAAVESCNLFHSHEGNASLIVFASIGEGLNR